MQDGGEALEARFEVRFGRDGRGGFDRERWRSGRTGIGVRFRRRVWAGVRFRRRVRVGVRFRRRVRVGVRFRRGVRVGVGFRRGVRVGVRFRRGVRAGIRNRRGDRLRSSFPRRVRLGVLFRRTFVGLGILPRVGIWFGGRLGWFPGWGRGGRGFELGEESEELADQLQDASQEFCRGHDQAADGLGDASESLQLCPGWCLLAEEVAEFVRHAADPFAEFAEDLADLGQGPHRRGAAVRDPAQHSAQPLHHPRHVFSQPFPGDGTGREDVFDPELDPVKPGARFPHPGLDRVQPRRRIGKDDLFVGFGDGILVQEFEDRHAGARVCQVGGDQRVLRVL